MTVLNRRSRDIGKHHTSDNVIASILWGPFAEQWNAANDTAMRFDEKARAAMLSTLATQMNNGSVAPWVKLAKDMKGPVLYLACGTDGVLSSLAQSGNKISCVASPDVVEEISRGFLMLDQEAQAAIKLIPADLRQFQLGQEFPLIVLPYLTLGLLPGPAEWRTLFKQIALHLAPKGVLAFEYPVWKEPRDLDGVVKDTYLLVEGQRVKGKIGWKLSHDLKHLIVNGVVAMPLASGGTQSFVEAAELELIEPKQAESLLAEQGLLVAERQVSVVDGIERQVWLCRRRSELSYPLWHPFMPMKDMEETVTILVEGKGCKVRDTNGREYIDASAGLWNTSCGLGNPEIIQAITDELHRLSYSTLFAWRGNEPALQLARELVEMAPSPLQWAYLTGSGSEAVDLSIKLARLFSRLQGRKGREIVYLDEGFHGTFFGSMSVSGITALREAVGPLLPGVSPIPTPNSVRCPPETPYVEFALSCAQSLEERAASGNVAAFIIEPILGSAGVVIPPREYFERIEAICRKHQILLILDEVASGMGRTGKWFAAEHYDLHPDILLLSKGLNSGYLPLGAVLFSAEIGTALNDRGLGVFHGSTYNGHPACCTAALATLRVMRNENLVERSSEMGRYFYERLIEIKKEAPSIKEVRGAGLMLSVVLNQEDGTLAVPVQVLHVYKKLLEGGVMAYMGPSSIIFCPPLIISAEEIDQVIEQLHTVLKTARLRLGTAE